MTEEMTAKLQKLASIVEGRQEISLAELAEEIEITDTEELEEFITKAVLAREINGKIDEREKKLCIYAHRQHSFGEEQWNELSNSVSVLLERLTKAENHVTECIEQRNLPWEMNQTEESNCGEEEPSSSQ